MSSENGDEALNSRHACAACKHQRRKCDNDCVFAPYFPANRANYFREVHKIFGVKNVTHILEPLSSEDRKRAVESLEWEAFAWKKDPVNGPLGHLRELEKEIELLKNQQQIVPYQSNSAPIEFNPNPAGIVANSNDVATNFGYTSTQNLGLDVVMNNYAGFMPRADMENQRLQGLNCIPGVPCYAIPQGQGRLVIQERGLHDVVAHRPPILPKQDAQTNQILDSAMRPAASFNQGYQRGSQAIARGYSNGSVGGSQGRGLR